jgi:hypothetical protein
MGASQNEIVDVYWNSHKKLWSVRSTATRLVIAHVDGLLLRNAKFHVSASGRERVRRERRKNVHAWICGEWVKDQVHFTEQVHFRRVWYNPYNNCCFQDRFGDVHAASYVSFLGDTAFMSA